MGAQIELFRPLPRNHQIKVGIDERTLNALDRFCDSIGKPRSRVAAEMLQGLVPMLNEFADRIEGMKKLNQLGDFKVSMNDFVGNLRQILDGVSSDIQEL
jgi:hypothetical protein